MAILFNEGVALLLDVSIKAVLLAGMAAAGLWILRVRNSNVRHRVWTPVLVGMLLLPLLVPITPTVSLPAWLYPDLGMQNVPLPPTADSVPHTADAKPIAASQPAASLATAEAAPRAGAVDPPTVPDETAPLAEVGTPRSSATMISMLLVVVYLAGVAVFAGRLLLGLLRARQLVRAAEPISLSPAYAQWVGATTVLASPTVRVPLTIGWRHPRILLPSDWHDWGKSLLAAVLAHEQAHVRRGDHWVVLLAELNRALYWFHPVAWFVRRRLTKLAEQICDDAVVERTDDRTGYARNLLAVAGRLTGEPRRLKAAGVAMVGEPQVERRINAILDIGRPLARRLGWQKSLMLVVIMTSTVLFAAGIRGANNDDDATDSGRSLLLSVVDDNGAPVADANVTVRIRRAFMGPWDVTHTHCDESGRVRVDVPETTPHYFAAKVELPGYAPFWAEWEQREAPDPIPDAYTVRLDPGRLIGGIVQNEEGESIEGASVNPQFNLKMREERTHQLGSGLDIKTDVLGRWTYPSFPEDLQQVTIRIRHPEYLLSRVTEPVSKYAMSSGSDPSGVSVLKRGLPIRGRVTDQEGNPLAGATVAYHDRSYGGSPSRVKTDSDGTYQFANGQTGEAFLTASADEWAPVIAQIKVEPNMDPVDLQLSRGQPLRVRVVDAEGEPLSGAWLSLWIWNENEVHGSLYEGRGKTDEQGIWQWPHAPEGSLRFAITNIGFDYIRARELTPGEEENIVTMVPESPEQSRVLKVSGRVIDARTKQPIPRFLITPGVQWREGETSRWLYDGRAEGREGTYRREFLEQEFATPIFARVLQIEADGYVPAFSRSITEREGDLTLDFELQPSSGEGFLVLTPNGESAADATVAICTPQVGPLIENGVVSPNSTCERISTGADGRFNITPRDGVFALMVLDESGTAYVTQEQLASLKTIRLEPWARVEGTLRIRNRPAANEAVTLDRDREFGRDVPSVHYQYRTTTDDDGNFHFDHVIPGKVQVVRREVVELGDGMSQWIPTHVVKVSVKPGETAHVDLSRNGRPVVAKLVMPEDVVADYDWNQAMVNLQSRPKDAPTPPKTPFPADIDPRRDRDAAMKWWISWKDTDEGKQFQEKINRYNAEVQAFKPVSYSAKVEPDGSVAFDDIPAGAYQLSVSALPAQDSPQFRLGRAIASLTHSFTVPEMEGGRSDVPLDLGELTLKAVPRADQAP